MAYINIPSELEGMRGLLAFRPAIAPALTGLTETILRSDEGLSMGQRELIGAYVSSLNNCHICQCVHSAAAQCLLAEVPELVDKVIENYENAPLSNKMKALLTIAEGVQRSGKNVLPEHIDKARIAGASDLEIHDTVLIAALFDMFNRYLDGLGMVSLSSNDILAERGKNLAKHGYK
jgi:uncharacterized peroxidase-related enzyme